MPKRSAFLQQSGAGVYDQGIGDQWGGFDSDNPRRSARNRGPPSRFVPGQARTARVPRGNPRPTAPAASLLDLTPPASPGIAPAALAPLNPRVRPAFNAARVLANARQNAAVRPVAAPRIGRPGVVPQPGVGIRDPARSINRMLGRTRALRRNGATVPHSHVCGWFMHGDNAGTARKTRKAKVLRDAVEMGLIAYKRGYKKLDTSVALRMRPVRFEDYQRGAGGQRGGLLPILPALAAAAPVIAKTAGLGLLSGAAAAGGGIALNKLLA